MSTLYHASGNEVATFRRAFEQRLPVMLTGPTGCGKTRLVEHMGALLGRAVDRGVAVESKPLEEFVADTLGQQSFTLALTMAFAITAVLLASVGLFGVVGQAVGERRREFALRIALGARRDDIGRMVLGEGFRWTAVGAAVGLPAALAAGQLLGKFLFEVSPRDPATYAAVVVILASSAFVAVAFPAWRAARVDPLVVLRTE